MGTKKKCQRVVVGQIMAVDVGVAVPERLP